MREYIKQTLCGALILAVLVVAITMALYAATPPKPIEDSARAKIWELYARELSAKQQIQQLEQAVQASMNERGALIQKLQEAAPGFLLDDRLQWVPASPPAKEK